MSEEFKIVVDDIIENITEVREKAKKISELHSKINNLMEDEDFDIRMSVGSMIISRAILDESDDFHEAYSYVARVSHTLVDVIDRHREQQEMEDAENEDNDADEDDGPVH